MKKKVVLIIGIILISITFILAITLADIQENGHEADSVYIYINWNDKTLQDAIDDDDFCFGCPSDMVSYWKLDGNTDDNVGVSDGTLINNPGWVNTNVNQGLDFSGTASPNNEYLNAGSDSSLDNVQQLTAMAWIYPESIGATCYSRIVGKGQWAMYIQDGCGRSHMLKFAKSFSGGDVFWRAPDNSLNYNQWQFVAVTYDGSDINNVPKLYINGQAQTLGVIGVPSGTANSDALSDFTIGSNDIDTFGDGINPFDGIMDEVAIYNRVLIQTEISQLYQKGLSGQDYCPIVEGSYSGNIIQGHRGEEITVNVGGNIKNLQQAINDNSLTSVATGISPSNFGIITGQYQIGDEIWIVNQSGEGKTLQQAINGGDLKCTAGEGS